MNRIRLIKRLLAQNVSKAAAYEYAQGTYGARKAAIALGLTSASLILSKDKLLNAKTAEVEIETPTEPQPATGSSGSENDASKSEDSRKGFRKRNITAYENKLRDNANPDKVFRYFATIAAYYDDGKREDVYMTPDDFVRSLTPSGELQPVDCLLDQFRKIRTSQRGSKMTSKELATVGKTFAGFGGYINYEDYIFLLTVLTTPKRNFEIAFRMFDLDGNGVVDADEFDKVTEIIMKGTTVAKQHKTKKRQSNISRYFFGESRDKELTSDEFLKFQEDIQFDILKMEFDKLGPDENNMISQKAFAQMIVLHANFTDEKQRKIKKKIKKLNKKQKVKVLNEETGEEETHVIQPEVRGVTFKEVYDFFEFMKNIHDVDTAFAFYAMSGKEIDADTMKSVARTVCGIELSEDIINLIFAIFDDDDSKTLSRREFVDVMKARLQRGLDRQRGIEFTAKLWALGSCACETYAPESVKNVYNLVAEKLESQSKTEEKKVEE